VSREIDALVAEHVMGWKRMVHEGKPLWLTDHSVSVGTTHIDGTPNCPFYSTDIAAAWEVVEKLSDADPMIRQYGEEDGSWTWVVDFEGVNKGYVRSRDICLAICLSALDFKGILVPELDPAP
jgi:hypothetical protein